MKMRNGIIVMLLFLAGGLMAACEPADPNRPTVKINAPGNDTVFVAEAGMWPSVNVEVTSKVSVDGYELTSFEIFLATHTDGVEEINQRVFLDSSPAPDLDGNYTWNVPVSTFAYSDYDIVAVVRNNNPGANERSASVGLRVDSPADSFPGGFYTLKISSVSQVPGSCLINQFLLSMAVGMIKDSLTFPHRVPSGAEIYAGPGQELEHTVSFPLPFPEVSAMLSIDLQNNTIVYTGQGEYVINFAGLVPPDFPGYDCIIGTTVDGVVNDLDPNDPDGTFSFSLTSIEEAPGGSCSLSLPSSGVCQLNVNVDAD